jgi:integrase
MHPEFVFVYSHPRHKTQNYRPIETMNNTAWQSWRKRCGLHGFRVHDLRHTVGMNWCTGPATPAGSGESSVGASAKRPTPSKSS